MTTSETGLYPWGKMSITKIIFLNKSGKLPKCTNLYCGGKKLDIVQNRKYPGSVVSCSGSNITGKVKLQEQADKAYFTLQKTMLKIGYDPRYCLDLFAKSVRPILTHNCETLNQIPEKKIKAVASGDKQLE